MFCYLLFVILAKSLYKIIRRVKSYAARLFFTFKFKRDKNLILFPNHIQTMYINLDESIDRRTHMEYLLSKRRVLAPVRIPAVKYVKENFDTAIYDRIFDSLKKGKLANRQAGVIGCYLSHHNAIARIDPIAECTLILEDDVYFTDTFLKTVKWFQHYVPMDWDVIVFDPLGMWQAKDRVKRFIYRPSNSYPYYNGSHAVMIKKESKMKVLEELSNRMIGDIDGLYFFCQNLNVYIARTGHCYPLHKQFGSCI